MLRKQPIINFNRINYVLYRFYNYNNKSLSDSDDLFPIPLLFDEEIDYRYLQFTSGITSLNIDELRYIISNDVFPFMKGNCINFDYIKYLKYLLGAEKKLILREKIIEKAISHNQIYTYFSKYGEDAYSFAMICKEKHLGNDMNNLTENGIKLLETIQKIGLSYYEQIAIERRNIIRKRNTLIQ